MKLWIATQNKHKIDEIIKILGISSNIKSIYDLNDYCEVAETGTNFRENAEIKARSLWKIVREPVIADDSGLEVDALDGRPGIHSMRYSAPNPSYEKNIDKLLRELNGVPSEKRTARFQCGVIFIDESGKEFFFEGTLEGEIGYERRGKAGFGFDPVFYLPEYGKSLAELPPEEKNRISHRGRALQKFKNFLESGETCKITW